MIYLMSFIDNAIVPSIIAVVVTHCLNMYNNWKRKKEKRINLLNGFLGEILAIQGLIQVRKEDFELQDFHNIHEYRFYYLPTTYNYFTVYESCAQYLGDIDNQSLQQLIIKNYVDLKGLFENIRDLGKQSIEFNKIILADQDNSFLPSFAKWHYEYSAMILLKQVPIIELQLKELSIFLSQEIQFQKSKKWMFIFH